MCKYIHILVYLLLYCLGLPYKRKSKPWSEKQHPRAPTGWQRLPNWWREGHTPIYPSILLFTHSFMCWIFHFCSSSVHHQYSPAFWRNSFHSKSPRPAPSIKSKTQPLLRCDALMSLCVSHSESEFGLFQFNSLNMWITAFLAKPLNCKL